MATLLSFSYFGLSVLALTLAPDRILSLSPVPVPRALLWTLRKFLASTASYIGRLLLRHLHQRMVDRPPPTLSWSPCLALVGRTNLSWFAWSIVNEGLGGIQGSDLIRPLGVSRPSSVSPAHVPYVPGLFTPSQLLSAYRYLHCSIYPLLVIPRLAIHPHLILVRLLSDQSDDRNIFVLHRAHAQGGHVLSPVSDSALACADEAGSRRTLGIEALHENVNEDTQPDRSPRTRLSECANAESEDSDDQVCNTLPAGVSRMDNLDASNPRELSIRSEAEQSPGLHGSERVLIPEDASDTDDVGGPPRRGASGHPGIRNASGFRSCSTDLLQCSEELHVLSHAGLGTLLGYSRVPGAFDDEDDGTSLQELSTTGLGLTLEPDCKQAHSDVLFDLFDTEADFIPGAWPIYKPRLHAVESADADSESGTLERREDVSRHASSEANEEACAITSLAPGPSHRTPGTVLLPPSRLVSTYVYRYYPIRFLLTPTRVRIQPHSVQVLLRLSDGLVVLQCPPGIAECPVRPMRRSAVVLDLIIRSRSYGIEHEVGVRSQPHSHLLEQATTDDGVGMEEDDRGTLSAPFLERDPPKSRQTSDDAEESVPVHASSRPAHLRQHLYSDLNEEVTSNSADTADEDDDVHVAATLTDSTPPTPTADQLKSVIGLPPCLFWSEDEETVNTSGSSAHLTHGFPERACSDSNEKATADFDDATSHDQDVANLCSSDSDSVGCTPSDIHAGTPSGSGCDSDHGDVTAATSTVVVTDLSPIIPLTAPEHVQGVALASAAPPDAASELRPQLNFPLSRNAIASNPPHATMVSTVVWRSGLPVGRPRLERLQVPATTAPGAYRIGGPRRSSSEPHTQVSPNFASCSTRSEGNTQHDDDNLNPEQDASPMRVPEADHDADEDTQSASPTSSSSSKRYPYIMRAVSQRRTRRLALAATDRDVDIREPERPHTYTYEPPPTPTRIPRAATPPLQSLIAHLKDDSDHSVDTFETCVSSGFSVTASTSTLGSRSVSSRQPSSHTTSTLDLSSDLFGDFKLPELPSPSSTSTSTSGAKEVVPALDLPAGLFEPFALPLLSLSSYPSSSSSTSQSASSTLVSADAVDFSTGPQTERKVPAELPRVLFPSSESELLEEASLDHFSTFQSTYAESVRSSYAHSLAEVGVRQEKGKGKDKWWRSLSLKARPTAESDLENSKSSTKLKLKRLVSLSAVRGPERRASLKEKRATWDGRDPVQADSEVGILGHGGSTGSGLLAGEGLGRRGKRKTTLSLRSTASASTCASGASVASGDSGSVRGLDVRMLPRYNA